MRVSSNSQYLLGVYGLQSKQSQLNHIQEQMSTQRRVVRPSDDPVAASIAVELAQSQSRNERQIEGARDVTARLGLTDSVLRQASTTISNIKTLAVQAGNGSLNDSNRAAIQKEMRERVKELIGLANTSDGAGSYLFGGTRRDVAPFAQTGPANASYQGDQQRQEVAISSGRQIAMTEPGDLVFEKGMWDTLNNLDAVLTAGPSGLPTYAADIGTALAGLDRGLSTLLAAQASVGGRMQEADALQDLGESLKVQYASQMSNLVDLDFAKAVSEFQLARTALESSQKTFNQIGQLSLFNFI